MQEIRIETTIEQDGELQLKNLPIQAGEDVEVIIVRHSEAASKSALYTLRGLPLIYNDPFGSVAETEWDALK